MCPLSLPAGHPDQHPQPRPLGRHRRPAAGHRRAPTGRGWAAAGIVAALAETAPDVVVMDIQMPRLDGIEATRFITGQHPGVRVVMLTMNEDDDTVFSALRAGASGYVLKGSGAEEVLRAIRSAAAGGMVFGAALAGRIAGYLAVGAPTPAAAVAFPELYVSNKTVRNAVSSIYAKLHAADRAEAIITAREAGFGRQDPLVRRGAEVLPGCGTAMGRTPRLPAAHPRSGVRHHKTRCAARGSG